MTPALLATMAEDEIGGTWRPSGSSTARLAVADRVPAKRGGATSRVVAREGLFWAQLVGPAPHRAMSPHPLVSVGPCHSIKAANAKLELQITWILDAVVDRGGEEGHDGTLTREVDNHA